AFLGTPDFAVAALDALVAAGHEIACVYTQPPRPGNRGRITPSPVQRRAEALGLPVRTPARLRQAEEQAAFAALDLDAAVVAAYGLLLPRAILAAPRHGCLNIHASLLPRWRGAAPIQRAILAGDAETGVTIMQMDEGLDTGAMLLKAATPVDRKTAGDLFAELAGIGARLVVDALARLPSLVPEPQDPALATHAPKIDKTESRIDWTLPADQLERLVRAMNPAPGAWFAAGDARIRVLAADVVEGAGAPGTLIAPATIACGSDALKLVTVQPAGRTAMPAAAWWRGARLAIGARL
ncbi:MAG: methionyl-tRNA formyltransferase, partial [Sphingomonadaceae bacterium]